MGKKGFLIFAAFLLAADEMVLGQTPQSPKLDLPPPVANYQTLPVPGAEAKNNGVVTAPCCQPLAVNCNDSSCCGSGIWVQSEYLLWWFRNGNTPPLVTTGDPTNPLAGVLGQADTRVLFGGNGAADPGHVSGWRLTMGSWIDNSWGVELSGFMTETQVRNFAIASDPAGNPPIYVPIYNYNLWDVNPPGEGHFVIAGNNEFNGAVAVQAATRLWGVEFNAVQKIFAEPGLSANLLFGFRYLGLDDSLTMSGFSNDYEIGNSWVFRDSFTTHNQFYGGQVGGQLSWTSGRLNVDLIGKVALAQPTR